MKEGFDIIIKDNFIDENLFKDVHSKISTYLYSPELSILDNGKHPWFTAFVPENIQDYLKSKCEKILNKKLKINFCFYTMLATVEPLPHCDLNENCDYQCLVYIKGNTNLNKGTGFYLNNELNTHVGFNENRGIIWHDNTVHTPLNWASDDKSKRFSIICQFKEY